jgi:hypothetical protein
MPARSLLQVDLMLGLTLLATIGFAATRPPSAAALPGRRALGWLLVAVPLPTVVGVRLFLPGHTAGGEAAFVLAIVAFAVGAVVILARDDEDDHYGEMDSSPAPWWPEFERQFRTYEKRQSRPRARV